MFLSTLFQLEVSEGLATGPVVTVEAEADMVHAGLSMTITVKVENYDGESYTPMALMEVTLSVDLGSFEPDSAITDVEGYCYFDYYAPEEVDGPTDVTITATAENGALDPIGSDDVTVTYQLEGVIIGPSQVRTGGKSEDYILKVTAGGDPVQGINVMPTVFGAGSLHTYSHLTNATGEAVLTINPGDTAGQINIIIQIGSEDYFSSAASKAILVVEELAPLQIQCDLGYGRMFDWGARRVIARVVRGTDPVGGINVFFSSSKGYFLNDRVSTDQTGNATGIFITSNVGEDTDYEVVINLSTSDGIETAYLEVIQEVRYRDVNLEFDFWYLPFECELQSQLYPGEELINEPEIRVISGHAADLTLKFKLLGGLNGNYTKVLATGLNTFDLAEGSIKDVIYNPGLISLYTVPDDPIVGTYLYRYYLTDRTETHCYAVFKPKHPDHADRELQVNIHNEGQDNWTFMYYMAGDNDLAPYMDHELERLENEAPNGEFKVYVVFDRSIKYDDVLYYDGERWRGAKKFDLEDGRENGIGPDRVSSSTSRYLYEFMLWVSYQSPSGHYGLVLSDHGKGYKGMCWDERREYNPESYVQPPDHLALKNIRNALQMFNTVRRKVDVVTLAACGMSCFEMATIFGKFTDYVVASQLPTYPRHGLTTEKVLEHLKGYDWGSYSPTPFQVSVDFVNGFIEESGGTEYDSSICVIKTDHVQELADQFNETMRSICNNWDYLGECFSTAYDQTTRVPGPELGEFEQGDLKEFLFNLREEVSSLILDPNARSVYNKLGNCIETYDEIIAYGHLIQGLNGINLYMPTEPIPTNLGIYSWDYLRILPFTVNYYVICLMFHSGMEYNSTEDDEDFTPLDPVDGYIMDDDDDGLGNRVLINLTPDQDNDQEIVYRVMIDCLQFSGKGGGYFTDILKKRIILDQDDIVGSNQVEVNLPVSGWYTIIARVLDYNNDVTQKFIVGNYSMEKGDLEGSPPSLIITASETTITVGDDLDLSADVSAPDGVDVDLTWDLDDRDGVIFDSNEKEITTRYLRPGNVTVTCVATDEEYTVVETVDIMVEPAVGNNAPTAGMTADVDEYGIVTLEAGSLSSDPDDDTLFYKFNFGDGNWTDWLEDSQTQHHYSRVGTYNCSVRVMDIRGAVSERSFELVTVETVSNKTGEIDDDTSDGISSFMILTIIIIAIVILILLVSLVVIFIVVVVRKKGREDDDEETW